MRYAVISDVHANESALRRVIADAKAQGAKAFVCLGDVVGYGPLPAEALRLVRGTCSAVVAGNHDDAVSGRGDADAFIDLAGDAAARHREALSPEDAAWLKSLPYTCSFGGAVAAHGDLTAPEEFHYVETKDDAEANFAATDAQLVFVGHTHVPCLFLVGKSGTVYRTEPQDFALEDGKRYIVNPGSVGYPRASGGQCFSSYAIYDSDEGTVEFRKLPFSVSSVMQRGKNPRRIGWRILAALGAAVALAAGAAAWFLAPKTEVTVTEVTEDESLLVTTKTLDLTPGARYVTPDLVLCKKPKSPPVELTTAYCDSKGNVIHSTTETVKSLRQRPVEIPAAARGAAKVVFKVHRQRQGAEPVIDRFDPCASADR